MANPVGAVTVCGDSKTFLNNNPNLPHVTQAAYSPGAKVTLGPVTGNIGAQMLSIISTPQRVSNRGTVLIGSPYTHTPGAKKRPLNLIDSFLSDREGLVTVDSSASKRMRKVDRSGKGLRHFSMKVCEKVQRKGTTSYNEVADELVTEVTSLNGAMATDTQVYDQKNIRRRVYDALNVLMAMNIISKEKKEIKWIGLPTNSVRECESLEVEKQTRLERISQKKAQLEELVLQQIAFKSLVLRNKGRAPPPPGSVIQLPFIVLNTGVHTVIDCSISSDKCEYLFNFDNTFEIHDDVEILKRMGMSLGLERGRCSQQDLWTARSLVPKALDSYVLGLVKSGKNSLSCHSSSPSADPVGRRSIGVGQTPSSFIKEEEDGDDEEPSLLP